MKADDQGASSGESKRSVSPFLTMGLEAANGAKHHSVRNKPLPDFYTSVMTIKSSGGKPVPLHFSASIWVGDDIVDAHTLIVEVRNAFVEMLLRLGVPRK